MEYGVKWVEDNLGVTRKALRKYEEIGLMPENKEGKARNYDEKDINWIWMIRVLQGIGYGMKEILDLVESDDASIDNTIGEKIECLENVKKKIDIYLGYAKMIKLTGRFPSLPKNIGSVKFDDFYRKVISGWNLKSFPEMEELQNIVDESIKDSLTEQKDIRKEIKDVLDEFDPINPSEPLIEASFMEKALCKSIVKRIGSVPDDPEVQALVSCMYENLNNLIGENKMTKEVYGRIYGSGFIAGDMARIREQSYGKEGCEFIANAMAIFGGYSGLDDPDLLFGKEK